MNDRITDRHTITKKYTYIFVILLIRGLKALIDAIIEKTTANVSIEKMDI